MTAKFVVRLLDEADALLAWAEVYATARPQDRGGSCPFFADVPTRFIIERSGVAAKTSIHWCDLDVARVQKILGDPQPVIAGQVVNYHWIEPVWLVPGMRDIPLPPVTVRAPVQVGVPVGTLAAIGTQT